VLLPPQAENYTCEESTETDRETAKHPALGQSVLASSIEPVEYSEHYHQDTPFSKEASEHIRSGFRSSLSDA
jgi:hypothetical protein